MNTMHINRRTDTHIHTHHNKLLYKHDGHFCFGQQSHIKYTHGYSISPRVVTRRESAHSERSRCVNWCLMFPWQTKRKTHAHTHSLNKFIFNTHAHTHTRTHRVHLDVVRLRSAGPWEREGGREFQQFVGSTWKAVPPGPLWYLWPICLIHCNGLILCRRLKAPAPGRPNWTDCMIQQNRLRRQA